MVVILKQNMRQTACTSDDERLRSALTNMRFASCSKEDLQFLQSRTIGSQPGRPTFNRRELRDVSIITAFNAQKDKINELGSVKFAKEHGQELITFYSDDSIAANAGDTARKPKEVRRRETVKGKTTLPAHRQQQLWDAHPCFAGQHVVNLMCAWGCRL
jgi:hypothetical protein